MMVTSQYVENLSIFLLHNLQTISYKCVYQGSFAFEDVYKKYLVENGLVDDHDFMRNYLLNKLVKTMSKSTRHVK